MLEKTENYNERLYSFQNFYFAGIHAGIQTAHTIARMSQKYSMNEGFVNLADEHELQAGELLGQWAKRDGGETIIVKNGGMAGDLRDLKQFLESTEHPYPFDYFNESQYAADGCLTNVSLVVPERVWKAADALRAGHDVIYTSKTDKCYAVYDTERECFVELSVDPGDMHGAYIISRRENFVADELHGREPGLFPNEELITFTNFDIELMARMNRSGLMS